MGLEVRSDTEPHTRCSCFVPPKSHKIAVWKRFSRVNDEFLVSASIKVTKRAPRPLFKLSGFLGEIFLHAPEYIRRQTYRDP